MEYSKGKATIDLYVCSLRRCVYHAPTGPARPTASVRHYQGLELGPQLAVVALDATRCCCGLGPQLAVATLVVMGPTSTSRDLP